MLNYYPHSQTFAQASSCSQENSHTSQNLSQQLDLQANLTLSTCPDYQLHFKNLCSSVNLDTCYINLKISFLNHESCLENKYSMSFFQVSLKTFPSISNTFQHPSSSLEIAINCIHRISISERRSKSRQHNKELIHSHQHKMFQSYVTIHILQDK